MPLELLVRKGIKVQESQKSGSNEMETLKHSQRSSRHERMRAGPLRYLTYSKNSYNSNMCSNNCHYTHPSRFFHGDVFAGCVHLQPCSPVRGWGFYSS